MKKIDLYKQFLSPPMNMRPFPFWSWNDKLQQDELNRQVEGFKEQGMGGFMMHAREGLETPYLGIEFMDRVKETVQTAKTEGMSAWLYDEDRYSSGMGGGNVPRLGGDNVRAKAITMSVQSRYEIDEKVLHVYKAIIREGSLMSVQEADMNEKVSEDQDESFLVFRKEIAAKNEWCHDDTYTDLLNPDSAKLFIQSTYEVYKETVGNEFGTTIPGIFTDEPTINGFSEKNASHEAWLPWTDHLPNYFASKNGYAIWSALPYIFLEGAFSAKARHDFWKTVTLLFCDSYTKQLSDWCEQNHLQFTGHFHSEGHLVGAARMSGAIMPHYRFLHIPGIDTLQKQTKESLTIKQAASVANQYGKTQVMTETYGVTGWDLTFEERKWIGDWQFVLGVNTLTHHLALYSLKGCRKRDYPPSFNYHTSWWKDTHLLEDYFARLSTVLRRGKAVRDVLVIHPSSTVWAMLGANGQDNNPCNQQLLDYNKEFNNLIDRLLAEHYDFDLGDELIMQDSSKVKEGKLLVHQAAYTTVILPPIQTMFLHTANLLKKFMDQGGTVIAIGKLPAMIQGEKSMDIRMVTEHPKLIKVRDINEAISYLEMTTVRRISIHQEGVEAADYLYMLRENEDHSVAFIVNNSRDGGHPVEIVLQGRNQVEEWDLLTGDTTQVYSHVKGERTYIKCDFGPADAKLFVLQKMERIQGPDLEMEYDLPNLKKEAVLLESISSMKRTAPNVLVLDQCCYRINQQEWSKEMAVWEAQREIRNTLDMRQVYANGGLQRHLWVHKPHENDSTPVVLRFSFYVKESPETVVYFAAEQLENFSVALNDILVNENPEGHFIDRSIQKVRLPSLKEGLNTLEISCFYDHAMELENTFLIGDFAVDQDRWIEKERGTLEFGDWCSQGYPHYCGSLIYSFSFEFDEKHCDKKVFLELGNYKAVTVSIFINDVKAGMIPWRARNGLDITKFLTRGENQISVELAGSPRNLFGPLHLEGNQEDWMDWWSFHPEGDKAVQHYTLVPYGIMEPVRILFV
ncbi:glycosyl hydrolase [Metabacillus halosaccharovorans]|uniref:glycosyl hydrolase n=1 Tax=Metabacillus halosaccharovorans TaxID=930124 RepID=UPI001C1F926D|nr:glycosyl hydrolase [Metabacillus halosaccharovorans]MBU7595737.1 hypothetical protein [Metabacillus halosaccharovorans]